MPTDRLDTLLRVIATIGLARSDTLRSRLAKIWNVSPTSSRVGLVVCAAIHRQLVDAQPGTVEWPGPKTRACLTLTPEGRARVVAQGAAALSTHTGA